jgi:hypothetical protein
MSQLTPQTELVEKRTGGKGSNMNKAPHVMILSTGAWDFDDMARQHIGENATLECNRATEAFSQAGMQPAIQNE